MDQALTPDPNPAPTYRPAGTDDVPAVLAFWQRAAEDSGRPADTGAALMALLSRDPEALLLATVGPRIVGTVIAGWDGWRAHLYRLAVDPDLRRQGFGSALVARAQERLTAFGAGRADAMVLDDNTDAHPAWTATGFARQPDWSRWVKPLPPPD